MPNKLVSFYDSESKHPLVRALKKKGFKVFEIAYANRSLSDWGWTVVNASKEDKAIFGVWMGGKIKDAIKYIESKHFPSRESELKLHQLNY